MMLPLCAASEWLAKNAIVWEITPMKYHFLISLIIFPLIVMDIRIITIPYF